MDSPPRFLPPSSSSLVNFLVAVGNGFRRVAVFASVCSVLIDQVSVMSRISFRGMLLQTAVGWSLGVQVDDPTEGCSNAIEAFQAGDVDLALEEARWCVEGLDQQK